MKLASYKDGSRDGQLLVVSADLGTAHYATGIATRLQQVLDDWNFLSPQLQELAQTLDHGKARHAFAFDPRMCMAPLPRAYLYAQPEGTGLAGLRTCRSDALLGPCDPPGRHGGDQGVTLHAGLAAITGDIADGAQANEALEGVRLLMFTAGLDGSTEGAAPLHTLHWAFAPVAITPDELGGAWQGGHGATGTWSLCLQRPGARVSTTPLQDSPWRLGEVLASLARSHGLRAGSIVGTGVQALPADWPRWHPGEPIRLELLDAAGHAALGAISPDAGPPPAALPPLDTPVEPADSAAG